MYEFDGEEAKAIREVDVFDTRNIRDEFKDKSHEYIMKHMKRNNLIVVMSNRIRDFNWGTVVRNANAFGASKCIFTGKRKYDRRGAVGAYHYTSVEYKKDIFEVISTYRNLGYTIVAAEYDENYPMVDINNYQWDEKTVMIFGEEGITLDDSILRACDVIVKIEMYGTVRSINVGTASGIFMNSFATMYPPQC